MIYNCKLAEYAFSNFNVTLFAEKSLSCPETWWVHYIWTLEHIQSENFHKKNFLRELSMFLVFLRFNFCTFTVVNELPNIDCEWLFFGPDYSTSTTRPPTTHLDSVECREESIGGTFIEIRDRYEKLSPKNRFL